MKHPVEETLNKIGITLDGNNPYDVQVRDKRFLDKILYQQSIGAGESYMDGWWDCERLDELFYRICRNNFESKFYSKPKLLGNYLYNAIFNQQTISKSKEVAQKHYNLGNRLYELMLGKSMAYTCSYWKDAQNLDEAQRAKYELVCKKLQLNPGEKVLDIGCGWGGLTKHMAENYGVEVVAIDIAKEPSRFAQENCKKLPVSVYNCDYRQLNIFNPNNVKFDKIVSIGVLEHIGYKNYDKLLEIARSIMLDDGIFLLHSIGGNRSVNFCDPWVNKHIFPNGMLPSLKQMGQAFENKFVVEDLHNFGAYYDKTLMAWYKNLNDNWDELKQTYDNRFLRMMNYYLLSCAGSFRARGMQLWQFVLTPKGKLNGYQSIR